jgi:glycosyltransferase involved in cell wall biosynthesis
MSKRAHEVYRRIRPYLSRLGVHAIARTLVPSSIRRKVAIKLGLRNFPQQESVAQWSAQEYHPDLSFHGVNFIGDLQGDFGVSQVSRGMVKALEAASIPTAYYETVYTTLPRTTPLPAGLDTGSHHDINLIDIPFFIFRQVLASLPREKLEEKYNIAIWGWELERFGEQIAPNTQGVNEIWVYSRHVQDSISQITTVPVVRMPPPILIEQTSDNPRSLFDLPQNQIIFLFSFSMASMTAKKNPYGIIEAFRRAFGNSSDGPLLVLKTQHKSKDMDAFTAELYRRAGEINARVISEGLTRQEMNDLLAACSCYVSLHRSEGFGLAMAEAMSLGKPVIATHYSGNTDFMTLSNCYPVKYHLREIQLQDLIYDTHYADMFQTGLRWAEPDLDHAAELMQHIVENPTEAAQVGQQAAVDINQTLSPAVIGDRMERRLTSLGYTRPD